MKKEIHPGVAVALVVIVFALVAFFFYRRTATPPAQAMGPQGPGAVALRKAGGDMTQLMSPAEKEMMQRSMGGRGGNMGSPPGGAR